MQKLEFSNGNHDGPRRAVAIVGVTYDVDGVPMTFRPESLVKLKFRRGTPVLRRR